MRHPATAFAFVLLGASLAFAAALAQTPQTDKPLDSQPARDVVKPPPSSPAATTNPGATSWTTRWSCSTRTDGLVSRAEAAGVPPLIKVFDKFDRNRDGKLDRIELEEAKRQPRWRSK
jgi:hypothetical protein